jgi:hypothetical protein
MARLWLRANLIAPLERPRIAPRLGLKSRESRAGITKYLGRSAEQNGFIEWSRVGQTAAGRDQK